MKIEEVIKKLKNEIDDICTKNEIEYLLPEEVDLKINTSANIFMTAMNLKKFIQYFNKSERENRILEWMGNSENFPGLFVRYIDTTTVLYTPDRLIYEKHLGICVTIQLLRPKNIKIIYYKTFENTYENIIRGKNTRGKKLEPLLRKKFLKQIETRGKAKAIKETAYKLIEKYAKDDKCKEYWIKNDSLANLEITEFRENSEYYFCDTALSYKELKLERYSALLGRISQDEEKLKKRMKKYREKKKELVNSIFRLYYRYYFCLELDENFEKIEQLYDENKLDELNNIIQPYIFASKKYGYIYISERVNSLIQRIYGKNLEKNRGNFSENENNEIAIYSYKGDYIKTLGGQNNE